jgi:hypothetical protein
MKIFYLIYQGKLPRTYHVCSTNSPPGFCIMRVKIIRPFSTKEVEMSANVKVSSNLFKVMPLAAVVLLVGLVLAFIFTNPPAIVQPAPVAQPASSGIERSRMADAARLTGLAENYAGRMAASNAWTEAVKSANPIVQAWKTANNAAGLAAQQARIHSAESARLTGLAENYAGRMADSKTWTEAVKSANPIVQAWKAANNAAGLAAQQARIRIAESARLTGLAENYAGRMADSKTWTEAIKSASPIVQAWKTANNAASLAAQQDRIRIAESTRLTGLAKQYLAQQAK